jgi:hypothetical protein
MKKWRQDSKRKPKKLRKLPRIKKREKNKSPSRKDP